MKKLHFKVAAQCKMVAKESKADNMQEEDHADAMMNNTGMCRGEDAEAIYLINSRQNTEQLNKDTWGRRLGFK